MFEVTMKEREMTISQSEKNLFSSAFSFPKEATIARLFAVRCELHQQISRTSILPPK